MERKTLRYKGLCLLMVVVMLVSSGIIPDLSSKAASKYITVSSFSELLAKKLGLSPIEGSTQDEYVNTLIDNGIIKDGDFTSYTTNITRTDALVLLNRADEYLYGNTTDEKLVQTVIDKRISDIKKVAETKREDIAKAFIKGYMKGYSNGTYSIDRNLKLTSKITDSGAKSCIKLLTDKSNRAKISPDGQLIRTTNLPYSYKKFPYILASYPNSYYDWMMKYEKLTGYTRGGKYYDNENLVDYASPANIDKVKGKYSDYSSWFAQYRKDHLDEWVDKVQTYLELVYSANYKTIDENWVEAVMKTDYSYGYAIEKNTRAALEQYVKNMKDNKTIVEYSKIRVDGSSLYFYNGDLYLRSYVRYRIVSSNVMHGVDTDTLLDEKPYNKILWSNFYLVDFTDFTLGKWRECGFDIQLAAFSSDYNYGVCEALLNEYGCKQYPVTK